MDTFHSNILKEKYLMIKNAIKRYRVARFFGLSIKICLKAFFFGRGCPLENFEKLVNKEITPDE